MHRVAAIFERRGDPNMNPIPKALPLFSPGLVEFDPFHAGDGPYVGPVLILS
jgi:hypothetical protein